ncbi:hypothetical protein Ddc_08906 [Ditylenchus destructor]|nr:hypothetical protein Ddc_08906 [Ditylenchus destructor]
MDVLLWAQCMALLWTLSLCLQFSALLKSPIDSSIFSYFLPEPAVRESSEQEQWGVREVLYGSQPFTCSVRIIVVSFFDRCCCSLRVLQWRWNSGRNPLSLADRRESWRSGVCPSSLILSLPSSPFQSRHDH